MPPDLDKKAVADYLCPVLAQTAAEQELFYTLFDQYAILLGIREEEESPIEKEVVDSEGDKVGENVLSEAPKKWRYILFGLVLAALLGTGAYFGYKKLNPPKIQGCMDRAAENFNPEAELDCCCKYAEDPTPEIIGCMDSTAINFNPEAEVACEDCCQYIGCRDSTAINFNARATQACEDCCEYAAKPTLTGLAQRDSLSYKPRFEAKPVLLPELKPLDSNFWTWIADNKNMILGVLYALLLAIALTVFLWKRAKQNYIARKERGEEPPYRLPIQIRKDRPIAVEQEFFLAMNRLRGRTESERQRLSVPKTVRATARSGGQIDFRYDAFSRPIEYLLLIDKNTEQNHQSQLYEHLYQRFVHHEVYSTRYFYDGAPDICWNEQHPSGINLERLLQLHGHARLLILSDGHSFINPTTGEVESWVNILQQWKERAILTPAPMANWDYQEATLARFFVVMPSNMKGLLEIVRYFDDLPTPSLKDWKYDLGKADIPIDVEEGENPIPILKKHFSPQMFRWITACAVYPELHWDLTLELGYVLSEPHENMVSFKNLAKLSRLDWFKDGDMPNEVRSYLLDNPEFGQEDRLAVRTAIINILEANVPDEKDSYAFEEHQMHLAINKLLVNRIPEEKQQWLELYRQQHAKGVPEDYVAAAELDKSFNQLLDFALPDWFREIFYPSGRMVLGTRSWTPWLIAGTLGLLIYGLSLFIDNPCDGGRAQLPFSDEEYCLTTTEDSLKFYALSAIRYIDSLQLEEVDRINSIVTEEILSKLMFLSTDNINQIESMNTLADEMSRNDGAFGLSEIYYKPFINALFNKAVSYYNDAAYENVEEILGYFDRQLDLSAITQEDSTIYQSIYGPYDNLINHHHGLDEKYSVFTGNVKEAELLLPQIKNISNPYLRALAFFHIEHFGFYVYWSGDGENQVLQAFNEILGVESDIKYKSFISYLIEQSSSTLNRDVYDFNSDTSSITSFFDLLHLRGNAAFLNEDLNGAQFNNDILGTAGLQYYFNEFPSLYDLMDYDFVDSVSNNLVRVRRDGKYGFINKRRGILEPGTFSVLPYDYASNFQNGQAVVTIGNRQCVIDTLGNEISCFDKLEPYQSRNNDLWGYRNERDIAIIPPQYEEAYDFSTESLARVMKDGKYGFIREDNNAITEFEYDYAGDFSQGLANVAIDGKWGFINGVGQVALELEYNSAEPFQANGQAKVEKEGNVYFINKQGDCVDGDCPFVPYSITVIDGVTGDRIPNAKIRVFDGRIPEVYIAEGESNADGIWELNKSILPTSGNYFAIASLEGFKPSSPQKLIVAPSVSEMDLPYLREAIENESDSLVEEEIPVLIPEPPLTTAFIDSRDGKSYNTVQIGDQIWMTENLNYAFIDSWCYLEMEGLCEETGRLYTYDAARKACPMGWRLPQKEDWDKAIKGNFAPELNLALGGILERADYDKDIPKGYEKIGLEGYYWTFESDSKEETSALKVSGQGKRVDFVNVYKTEDSPSLLSCRCVQSKSKQVRITDRARNYPSINSTDCLDWHDEEIKSQARKTFWQENDFDPKNGMIGTIIDEFTHCNGTTVIYLLEIDGFYVPMGEGGISFDLN